MCSSLLSVAVINATARRSLQYLSYFPYTAQGHLPGWHYPQWAEPSYTNLRSRKCSTDMPTGQSNGELTNGQLSSFLSPMCVRVTIEANHDSAY